MAHSSNALSGGYIAHRDDISYVKLDPKHKVFLSHSGAQKDFVEQLCVDLEKCNRFPFFDKRHDSLPIGEHFPGHIFAAIRQCHVGVVVFSDEFFMRSTWPMVELAAMVKQAKLRKSSFKIMPVFYGTSLDEFNSPVNRSRWLSRWHELALKNQKINLQEWEAALNFLRPINSLVYDGMGEVKFRKVIVDAICEVVPFEIKSKDSHIQGKLRLCKVIQKKITIQQSSTVNGICIVGLYGIGGIGKTSICKVLCNEYFSKFQGRVCHAELERGSQKELLREVVKRLTNTNREFLNEMDVNELLYELDHIKDPIFLALDNMFDSDSSIKEVKSYLSTNLPLGSIIMVTARSMNTLMRMRPFINENACLEMPELEEEEAKSLFVNSSNFEFETKMYEQLILRCIKQCFFQKGNDKGSYHYHPLALDVLGRQLGFVNPNEWGLQLDKIDEDIFNQSKENHHPIFSILRRSFDALSLEDQMLFMDIALCLPNKFSEEDSRSTYNVYEWLGMVHRIPTTKSTIKGLERLKTKSLLENVGDGIEVGIGMHDLWRAFCVAETKSGMLRYRHWVHDHAKKGNELIETSPSGTCWENVRRIVLLDYESLSLERVNFAKFSNITVMRISRLYLIKKHVMDLSGLLHLKSLEISGSSYYGRGRLVVKGLSRDLGFLSIDKSVNLEPSQQFVKQIESLKELQWLRLVGYGGRKLPDMSRMTSMRKAIFPYCDNIVTSTGLSSKLTNLQSLNFRSCNQLQSLPGVGDLVALEELLCNGCQRLKSLSNLRKLKKLRTLDVSGCPLIMELPGLGDLVALEELYGYCAELSKLELPDLHKLRNLRVLHIFKRRLESVPGFESLLSLQKLVANFRELVDWPNLQQLTKLQTLHIDGWSLAGLKGLDKLTMLQSVGMHNCSGVDELSDLRSLTYLLGLRIENCEFKDVSGLCNLEALENLVIYGCKKLEMLPDMQRLTRLKYLEIGNCTMLRGWDCSLGQVEASSSSLDVKSARFDRLDSQSQLTRLQALRLSNCELLDLTSIGSLSQLKRLDYRFSAATELPDLSLFPQLKYLCVKNCHQLRRLTSREPMHAMSEIEIANCSSIATLPDLCKFLGLLELRLWNCERITTLSCYGPLIALTRFDMGKCNSLEALPCLGMFPSLSELRITKCNGLMALSSSQPLLGLKEVIIRDCSGLKALLDLGMFPALGKLDIGGCSQLSTLSCTVPLTLLKLLDVSGCTSFSQNDLWQFRAFCPQCEVVDADKRQRFRRLGCF